MRDDGLVAFLAGCLDEDEAAARRAASESPWRVSDVNDDGSRSVRCAEAPDGLWHGDVAEHIAGSDAAHIARHDPARVLAEAAAKRAILAEHSPHYPTTYPKPSGQPACGVCDEGTWDTEAVRWPCPTVRHVAAVYGGRPGYDPAWAPTAAAGEPQRGE